MYPKRGTLAALAKALDIGEAFFSGADLEIDTPMLRRTSGGVLSDVETARLEAILSFWTEQYLAKEKESGMAVRFQIRFRNLGSPRLKMSPRPHSFYVNNGTAGTARCPAS